MSYDGPGAEEKTLEMFFDTGNFTPGGETSQLRDACTAVEHFIAQEMWCVWCSCGAMVLYACVCFPCGIGQGCERLRAGLSRETLITPHER